MVNTKSDLFAFPLSGSAIQTAVSLQKRLGWVGGAWSGRRSGFRWVRIFLYLVERKKVLRYLDLTPHNSAKHKYIFRTCECVFAPQCGCCSGCSWQRLHDWWDSSLLSSLVSPTETNRQSREQIKVFCFKADTGNILIKKSYWCANMIELVTCATVS